MYQKLKYYKNINEIYKIKIVFRFNLTKMENLFNGNLTPVTTIIYNNLNFSDKLKLFYLNNKINNYINTYETKNNIILSIYIIKKMIHNPSLISHIEKETTKYNLNLSEILYELIKLHHKFFRYVHHKYKTYELCKLALLKDVFNIRFISNDILDMKLCKYAISIDPIIIVLIKTKMTYELYKYAISKDVCVFQCIPKNFRTYELCDIAMLTSNESLIWIPFKLRSYRVSKTCIKNNHNLIDYVPPSLRNNYINRLYITKKYGCY
jgi:hypothetical protein